jgi:NADPH:quinone reductase-like Zn-dependent oxidoreductase
MKAITYSAYAGPEQLQLADIPEPSPKPNEVRVRVLAASLNPFDWHLYRGDPLLVRTSEGWRVKDTRVLGADLSGVVDAVGADVTEFAIGDRIIAEIGRGAVGEYATVPVSHSAALPEGVSFEHGAAVPMAGLTALQAVRDSGRLVEGERVLVWGASGGVGHLAVQIARILGASQVDAVCSGANSPMVSGLGADTVFDYASGTLPSGPYDVIIDSVCTRTLRQLKSLLAPGGRVITLGGIANGKILGPGRPMMGRIVSSKFLRVPHEMVSTKISADDLAWLAAHLADGSLTPVIQRTFALGEAQEACRVLEDGHVAGKLVIRVSED